MECCDGCRFFKIDPTVVFSRDQGEEGIGDCRRHAPTSPPRRPGQSGWPQTWGSDWCGDFAKRGDQPAAVGSSVQKQAATA